MTAPRSDALVFFGATGDLAYKQIFPALQALIRHGRLDMPVIGVAKVGWGLDQLKARARDSLEKHGGLDPAAYAKLCSLLGYIDGDPTLFAREDSVEAAWRVVDPVLGNATPLFEYEQGAWGPPEAERILAPDGGWHNPKSLSR